MFKQLNFIIILQLLVLKSTPVIKDEFVSFCNFMLVTVLDCSKHLAKSHEISKPEEEFGQIGSLEVNDVPRHQSLL